MASGRPFHLTSSRKVTRPITPPCCSSTKPREWSFASSYRMGDFDDWPGSDPAPESYADATELEARMPGLQNPLRGQGRLCLFDSLARRKRTRRAGTKSRLPLLRQTHVHTLFRERRRIRALLKLAATV